MVVLRKPQAFGWAARLVPLGLLALLAGGCQTAAGTGAATGGALGAGIGAIASRGCPGGALIGGLLGAGAGGLVGAGVDADRQERAQRAVAADVAARAPSLEDVARMTGAAVPPGQIIEQIRTSGVVYRLTPDQLVWLNQQGVNPAVVQEMQATAYRMPRRIYTASPVVVVEQPPPPVAVGFGMGFR